MATMREYRYGPVRNVKRINGRWWKEFADFAARLADTFEGVSLENIRTNGDAANAKRLMSKFRSA